MKPRFRDTAHVLTHFGWLFYAIGRHMHYVRLGDDYRGSYLASQMCRWYQ